MDAVLYSEIKKLAKFVTTGLQSEPAAALMTLLKSGVATGAETEAFCAGATGPLALQEITGSTLAMTAVAASSTAMTAVIASPTALSAVVASSTAMTAVIASPTALSAVVASSTAMTAVAASSTAMTAVIASPTALSAVVASSTAMTAVNNNNTALDALYNSSLTTKVNYSSTALWSSEVTLRNGAGLFVRLTSKAGCAGWGEGSVSTNEWMNYDGSNVYYAERNANPYNHTAASSSPRLPARKFNSALKIRPYMAVEIAYIPLSS